MAKQKAPLAEPVNNTVSKDTRKQGKEEAAVITEVKPQAIDKDLQKQIQKLQKVIAQIEHNIETLNTEKAAIELEMANPAIYSDPPKMHIVEKSYHDKNALIRSMNKEYEIAFNDLLILESK
jgi:ATP-binding cassette subfamily F protein 3